MADQRRIAMRRYHQTRAQAFQFVHLLGARHGARADQRAIAERTDKAGDAGERVRRIHRHLKNAEAGLDQRFPDGLRSFRLKAAQYRKQRQGIGKRYDCHGWGFLLFPIDATA
jgi:hypothetical protein